MSPITADSILEAAFTLAEETHFATFNRDQVAERAGVSLGSVSNAFGGMKELRDRVVQEAVKRQNVAIVAQGLGAFHPAAVAAPEALKRRASEWLRNT